jgi:hypothetical protein
VGENEHRPTADDIKLEQKRNRRLWISFCIAMMLMSLAGAAVALTAYFCGGPSWYGRVVHTNRERQDIGNGVVAKKMPGISPGM